MPNITNQKAIYLVVISVGLSFSCGQNAKFSGQTMQSIEDKRSVTTSDAVVAAPINIPDNVHSEDQVAHDPAEEGDKTLKEPSSIKILRRQALQAPVTKSLSFPLESETVSENLVLQDEYYDELRVLNQATRPLITQFFQQGKRGEYAVEKFNQKMLGILDLLIVVDNSGSMSEEQENLSKRLSALLQHIDESDWRINVVTTDPKEGCSRAVLRKGDPDLMKKFQEAVTPGTFGSGHEEGVRMAIEGLSCKSVDWVRPNSSLGVLIVSDEDNCSDNGLDCKGSGFDSAQVVLDHFEQKMGRVVGKSARVYGIFWEPGTQCTTGAQQAFQYSELVKKSGGQWGSICDADFGPTLRRISADVSEILDSEIELKNKPDINSLKIRINGSEILNGFKVQDKKLIFDRAPPYNATIEVSYQHSSTPVVKKFKLNELPAVETLQVVIKNSVVDPKSYQFDEVEQSLVFQDYPEENVEIKVQARQRVPLRQEFDLGIIPKFRSASLTIDGKVVTAFTVDEVNGQGVLKVSAIPKDGQKLSLSFNIRKGPQVNYPLALVANPNFELVRVRDVATGQPVSYEVRSENNTSEIVFAEKEVVEGRKIQLDYKMHLAKGIEFDLPAGITLDQLKVGGEGADKACVLARSDANFQKVRLNCNLPAGTVVLVEWLTASTSSLAIDLQIQADELSGLGKSEFLNQARWIVKIDGAATKDFNLVGSAIHVNGIPNGAKYVDVEGEFVLTP